MCKKILEAEYLDDISVESIRIYEEDIISTENSLTESPFQIDKGWENIVTNFIKDKEKAKGVQIWRVKVIGDTQNFIHVLDNSRRSWVDITEIKQSIMKNEYIEIEVEIKSNGELIKANKVTKLSPII